MDIASRSRGVIPGFCSCEQSITCQQLRTAAHKRTG